MKTLAALTTAFLLSFGLVGCDDGGAENLGEEIDQMADDAGDTMDNIGNDIEDACEEATDENC